MNIERAGVHTASDTLAELRRELEIASQPSPSRQRSLLPLTRAIHTSSDVEGIATQLELAAETRRLLNAKHQRSVQASIASQLQLFYDAEDKSRCGVEDECHVSLRHLSLHHVKLSRDYAQHTTRVRAEQQHWAALSASAANDTIVEAHLGALLDDEAHAFARRLPAIQAAMHADKECELQAMRAVKQCAKIDDPTSFTMPYMHSEYTLRSAPDMFM